MEQTPPSSFNDISNDRTYIPMVNDYYTFGSIYYEELVAGIWNHRRWRNVTKECLQWMSSQTFLESQNGCRKLGHFLSVSKGRNLSGVQSQNTVFTVPFPVDSITLASTSLITIHTSINAWLSGWIKSEMRRHSRFRTSSEAKTDAVVLCIDCVNTQGNHARQRVAARLCKHAVPFCAPQLTNANGRALSHTLTHVDG